MAYDRICISAGHGKLVRGASCSEAWGLDEVDEAWLVVDQLAVELKARGAWVAVFKDMTSTTQGQNLDAIVNWHNKQTRDLDVSVHFNAHSVTNDPRGVEVLWVTQEALAEKLSAAIASVGFIDRGAKYRSDLKFLNATDKPSVLLEICFVDSKADAEIYDQKFANICALIANTLAGVVEVVPEPPVEPELPDEVDAPQVDIVTRGDVLVTLNGKLIN